MTRDPIVEEVRAIRDEFAKRHGYDIDAIVASLQKASADAGRQLVSLPPQTLPAEDLRHVAPSAEHAAAAHGAAHRS